MWGGQHIVFTRGCRIPISAGNILLVLFAKATTVKITEAAAWVASNVVTALTTVITNSSYSK